MRISDYQTSGEIHINSDINFDLSIESQLWSLNQNVFYINYENGISLDVGCDNEFEVDGKFNISIIGEKGWDIPIWNEKVSFDNLLDKVSDFEAKILDGSLIQKITKEDVKLYKKYEGELDALDRFSTLSLDRVFIIDSIMQNLEIIKNGYASKSFEEETMLSLKNLSEDKEVIDLILSILNKNG